MQEIDNLIKSLEKLQEVKNTAAKLQHFELSATLRSHEVKLLIQIGELTKESEKFLKYAVSNLETALKKSI